MGQRVLLHDYSGHPFQPQLSRRLAARGHEVLHVYSKSVLIPQGAVEKTPNDPVALSFAGIRLPGVIDKQALVQRFFREREYGRLLAEKIRGFEPDLVLSSSTPLDAQAAALRATHSVGGKFVFWLQDIQGIAIETLLGARFNGAGRMVGRYYTGIEKRLLRASDAVVSITEDFGATLGNWGVDEGAIHVIPNWASMDELPVRPKNNEWARAQALENRFVFLYSGTLGMKHDPEFLIRLALAYQKRREVAVVVVSEGAKAEWLKQRKAELGLEGLRILPFQRYDAVPDVMGTADVLVALLDRDASKFSVPSKVLAYHCAARPILLAVPKSNLVSRIVTGNETGIAVEPADWHGFAEAAEKLRAIPELRQRLGMNALAYARRTFDLDRIADRFESVFRSVLGTVPAEALEEEEVASERA